MWLALIMYSLPREEAACIPGIPHQLVYSTTSHLLGSFGRLPRNTLSVSFFLIKVYISTHKVQIAQLSLILV